MQKNVASQIWIVFAFDRTDNTPKTGDAANITANMRIDGGAANAIDDLNPTELEDGYYFFNITAAECNGDNLLLTPQSATGNIQVIAVPGAVWTRPSGFDTLTQNAIAQEIMKIDIDTVEGTAAIHSLCTAILKAVSRVRDNAGTLETYRTDGTTLHLSQVVTTDTGLEPVDELGVGT